MSNSTAVASTGFALTPANLNEAMNLATMICNSQLCPTNYKGKPEDTLVAMMMGNEVGLNPLQAIQNIAVINGRPSIYGDALMALVQNHPKFGGINEVFDESSMTATCIVHRKGGEKHTQKFSEVDAKAAKLWGKAGPWTQYPKRMLAMRARGFALRNQFADALAGLISVEEAEDLPIERELNPTNKSSEPEKQKAISKPEFTQDAFNKQANKWASALDAGKDPDDLVAMIKSKYELSDELEHQVRTCNREDAA